ncbi:hypothetical protein CLTEP_22970 [Clostridium tepidiprofundi DSM 19306]|uniref:Transposase IS204/IS1001/IS1096/IS1165 helix-turn-helix domain-containing protein n=1 Tax=Clostridium tepidiprofundi DSM 19306 TaxID=1121338 RepID=A0A151AWW7_9CLOT|nr:helix-turn-helix domain-containing protein [Clostridium tepidiprofundi]KYH32052.1 hypothetical protein CLTEP_22970 [Clostridium tepidiprofundi DSM 19306]
MIKKEFFVRDIPIHGKPVILIVEKIRLRCACCGHRGISVNIPFLNKYQRKTDRFIEFIAKEVAKTSINEVCEQLQYSHFAQHLLNSHFFKLPQSGNDCQYDELLPDCEYLVYFS